MIDVDWRCINPGGPAEPEWDKDTERVWVNRGSAELAALEKLIAEKRERIRIRKWQWQCPPSPVYDAPEGVDGDMDLVY